MSDMFFDTASFDFDSLTDVVGLNETNPQRTAIDRDSLSRNSQARTELDDINDLISERPEFEEETDINDDVSDLNAPITPDSPEWEIDALDDSRPIVFEGMRMTAGELKELYKAKSKVDADSSYFAEQAERFDADNRMINQRALMQQTVLENNINILRNRLNNPAITDADYAQTSRDLKVAENSLYMLSQEVNQIMNTREQQQQLVNGYRIRAADQEMANSYPQWNQLRGDVLNYAQELNIPAVTLEKVYDKGIMTALLKAYLYDGNKKRIQSKTQTDTAINPRSTVGAKSSTRNQAANAETQAKAKQVLSKMGTSRTANVDAFAFLKD